MPEPPSDSVSTRTLEMAHILFMDIVAYSRLPMDQQQQVLLHLQEAVRETKEYTRAQSSDQLIRLPTGDGMALVFFGDVEAPVRCALELHRILQRWPEIHVRMGIHSGPVYRVEDINAARNVAGGGINIAQRVMDCGDAGHILVSKSVADVLDQVSTWNTALCDMGEAEVKHGVRIHLYNLCSQEAGNQKLPQKLITAQTAAATARSQSRRKKLSLGVAGALGLIAAIVTALFIWGSRHRVVSLADSASPRTVAVLPFQNVGSDKDTDFLRLALPDEIANTLSYVQSFSIRPFAMTSKYNGSNVDLQEAGRDMGVTSIVTGHFLREGDQLDVTLEAVDVGNNRSVWRDTINVAASDKIAMRERVTAKVRQGLVPVLGGSSTSGESGTQPKSEEAYDLYLRSIAVPHDAAPNKDGIAMLERAVDIDPSYAPAWDKLAVRYYWDAHYGGGGQPMLKRSASASERALALDPNSTDAAVQLVANRTEEGEIGNAYAEAAALVQRRPDSALAHFILGYVLRYAGLLDDSVRECETASKLDRSDFQFRSCSYAFAEQGNLLRAMEYVKRDAGSEWSNAVKVSLLMREGKMSEAQQAAQQMTDSPSWMGTFLKPCLNKAPTMELHRLAELAESELLSEHDPEDKYSQGAILAACGEKQIAYAFLQKAIAENYCAHQALQSDPLLVKLRGSPEFDELLFAAKDCENRFLAQRNQSPH
jgi:TolB-like protein/class 3 adenylate cyclase